MKTIFCTCTISYPHQFKRLLFQSCLLPPGFQERYFKAINQALGKERYRVVKQISIPEHLHPVKLDEMNCQT